MRTRRAAKAPAVAVCKRVVKKIEKRGPGRPSTHDRQTMLAIWALRDDPNLTLEKAVKLVNATRGAATKQKKLPLATLRKRVVKISGKTWTGLKTLFKSGTKKTTTAEEKERKKKEIDEEVQGWETQIQEEEEDDDENLNRVEPIVKKETASMLAYETATDAAFTLMTPGDIKRELNHVILTPEYVEQMIYSEECEYELIYTPPYAFGPVPDPDAFYVKCPQ